MSYVVLARRWRPKVFEEVVGQEHITRTLTKAIKTNRIAHAYLFAGPRGIGKTTTARILAKALNCDKGVSPTPCNKCASCREVSEGNSIDVLEIDGASNRGIDEVRELRGNVKFAPARDRLKIYIIDEVHMLTPEAFNALLKTLEEPPEHVKFIFATTAAHKLPLTIISRCQRFDFRRISIPDVTKRLKQIARAEKVKATEDAIFAIARNASGSLRDAESTLDQLISFSEGEIKLEDVNTVLGLVDQETFSNLSQAVIDADTVSALKVIQRILNEGSDIEEFIRSWQQYWRDVLMAKMEATELIELPESALKELIKQSEHFSVDELFRIIEILTETVALVRKSISARIPLEIAVAQMTRIKASEPSSASHGGPAQADKSSSGKTATAEKQTDDPQDDRTQIQKSRTRKSAASDGPADGNAQGDSVVTQKSRPGKSAGVDDPDGRNPSSVHPSPHDPAGGGRPRVNPSRGSDGRGGNPQGDSVVTQKSRPEKSVATDNPAGDDAPGVNPSPGSDGGGGNPSVVYPSVAESPSSEAPGSSTPSEGNLTIREVREKWPVVLANVKKEKLTTSAFLSEGTPVNISEGEIAVAFDEDASFHRDGCNKRDSRRLIEKALEEVFHSKFKLNCVSDPLAGKKKEEKENKEKEEEKAESEEKRRKKEILEKVSRDPIVKKTMEIFNVRIIDVGEEGKSE